MKQPKSKKARKQRTWRGNSPLHKRGKMTSAPLNEELKKKYKRRSLSVRRGDVVTIIRGGHKGTKGEIVNVDLKTCKILIEGVTRKKTDGSDVPVKIDPSNVRIDELYFEDRERREVLERKLK